MTTSSDSTSHSQQVLILFGPPGSGKGTQASLLAEQLNYYYFETSKLLEERFREAKEGEYVEVDGEKFYLEKEKEVWKSGVLNSPPFVTEVVKEEIREVHQLRKNLLLAGSPRTLYEAERVLPLLEQLYGKDNITIIMLELQEEETMKRNTQRRICELMRHSILATEETAGLTKCPLDGSKLMKRDGLDDPENIATRLQQYRDRTFPMQEYFESEGYQVCTVDGGRSVSEVFDSLLEALGKK